MSSRPSAGPDRSLDALRRRFAYDAWANRRTAAALLDEDRHAAARRLLAHAVFSERVWLHRIEGTHPASKTSDFWPELSAAHCRALVEDVAREVRAFLEALEPEQLSETALYHNSHGERFKTPVGEILEHLALHASYHRGQVAAALRAAGDDPPMTDYIAFQREGH